LVLIELVALRRLASSGVRVFAHPAAAHLESAGLRGRGNQRNLDSPRGVVLLTNLLANYSMRGRTGQHGRDNLWCE
jgi:hypothetical protein